MQPTRITYHGLDPSAALTEFIQTRSEQLDYLGDRIDSMRVVVDSPHQHHRHGNRFDVRVEVRLASGEVVVGTEPAAEDAYQAVRSAFDAIHRQLETARARKLGKQRAHESHRNDR